MYVYNKYFQFFRFPDKEWKFGSMGSVMNVSKLTLAETGLEVSPSLVFPLSKR